MEKFHIFLIEFMGACLKSINFKIESNSDLNSKKFFKQTEIMS